MNWIKFCFFLLSLQGGIVFGQEYLTISTNDKEIDFYNLSSYTVYTDSSNIINPKTDMYVYIFKKNKVKGRYSHLTVVPPNAWKSFLSRCKKAKQFDFNVYDLKDRLFFSAMYIEGRLTILEPELQTPIYLNSVDINW